MEPAAARASIIFLQDAGLVIRVFVTDRFCKKNPQRLSKTKSFFLATTGQSLFGQSCKKSFHTFCTRFRSDHNHDLQMNWSCYFIKFDSWHLTHNMEKALWRAEKLKSCGKSIGNRYLHIDENQNKVKIRRWSFKCFSPEQWHQSIINMVWHALSEGRGEFSKRL